MRISDWSSDVCSSDLHGQPEADPPAPGKEGFCRQSGGQHQQYDRGQQVTQRHPGLGKAAPEPAAAVWTMLSDPEDGPAQFAAKRKSLSEIGRATCRERECQYV